MITTPLRYPGGKAKALDAILPLLPNDFREFREPFVGGGSVFLALRQKYPDRNFWINDLNAELFHFWEQSKRSSDLVLEACRCIREECTDGRALFQKLSAPPDDLSDVERAVRFFILNRITFSGTVEAGGYSEKAFQARFTPSSITRLASIPPLLENVCITNLDYEPVINAKGEGVLLFLDPPYFSATASRLYGKRGLLHLQFDHRRFAEVMHNCSHRWLITYDDCPEVRQNFAFAHMRAWEFQYGMNNYKQATAAKGKELFIANYPLPQLNREQRSLSLFQSDDYG